METPPLILPQKEATIPKHFGIHLGELPTWIIPLREWVQPQALFENLEIRLAVPLTRSPSISAVVMAMAVLGGVCKSLLGKEMRSVICVGGALPLSPSSRSPCFSQRSRASWPLGLGLRKVESFKMHFYFVGCGAHHVCWRSLCSSSCVS